MLESVGPSRHYVSIPNASRSSAVNEYEPTGAPAIDTVLQVNMLEVLLLMPVVPLVNHCSNELLVRCSGINVLLRTVVPLTVPSSAVCSIPHCPVRKGG